jgi:hypothetical protein
MKRSLLAELFCTLLAASYVVSDNRLKPDEVKKSLAAAFDSFRTK